MKFIFRPYLHIPRIIIYLIVVDVCLQLINAEFTLQLNFQMLEHGYKDFEISSMIGNRSLSVLICALPLALLAKGRRLKPFILAGSIASPIVALLLIWAIHIHNSQLVRLLMTVWGVTFSMVQVLGMPYTMLNGKRETETASIALFFAAGNFTMIVCGGFNWLLPHLHPFFSVECLLIIFSALALVGVFFAYKLPDREVLGTKIPLANVHSDYDWSVIVRALIPTFMIAFGAGFTIPVISLFFYFVHGMDAQAFSLMNVFAFILVTLAAFLAPHIKGRYGYKFSITFFQGAAIVMLFVLGTTEWYNHWHWALWVAGIAFIVRQPLMNIAVPMTSELTMNYVGEKNREIISAMTSAIWSGSWFASAQIFAILREGGLSYSNIIFITVAFYIVGVVWYYWLIKDYERKTGQAA
ncbi:MAG: hypothetical protein JWO03_3524 [Bacteroidetes bacterium]|nr:hypothetical protein [Bacteroidota bacterium]